MKNRREAECCENCGHCILLWQYDCDSTRLCGLEVKPEEKPTPARPSDAFWINYWQSAMGVDRIKETFVEAGDVCDLFQKRDN